MESNDQGHELDSLSSTRYLYNPQADSVRSIPAATLIQNDTKVSTNWKFTIMVIFITIVVSLLVSFIFDYYSNNQSNCYVIEFIVSYREITNSRFSLNQSKPCIF